MAGYGGIEGRCARCEQLQADNTRLRAAVEARWADLIATDMRGILARAYTGWRALEGKHLPNEQRVVMEQFDDLTQEAYDALQEIDEIAADWLMDGPGSSVDVMLGQAALRTSE